MELFDPKKVNINFAKYFKEAGIISTLITILGIVLVLKPGFNYGIDFRGGTEAHVTFKQGNVTSQQLREALGPKLNNLSVVDFKGSKGGAVEYLVTAQSDTKEGVAGVLRSELKKFGNENETWQLSQVSVVGPKVSVELKKSALLALLYTCLLIGFYMFWRFDLRFAPGALACIFHDLLVTSAFLVLTRLEFDSTVVAGLLTLAGYSINDTVVIFDRIREMEGKMLGRSTEAVINESINSTLSRTVLTSGSTFMSCVVLYLLGGETLRAFSVTLMVGIFVGTYSSVFVASPLFYWMAKRQQRLDGVVAKA